MMTDKSKKDLEDIGEYITDLQNNFRLAIQKAEELAKSRETLLNHHNEEIEKAAIVIEHLQKQIKLGNSALSNIMDFNKRYN